MWKDKRGYLRRRTRETSFKLTISAKIITDFIVFRINQNGNDCNLIRNSLAGHFFEITDVVFSFVRWIARSVVPFARICAFVFARVHNASSLSCSISWTTTRSCRSLARTGSTCSTGTPSSQALQCACVFFAAESGSSYH